VRPFGLVFSYPNKGVAFSNLRHILAFCLC
jgi:hypothetical protein